MAIETQPERAQGSGGGDPLAGHNPRPWWRRPAIHTAIIGAVIGYVLGHLLGDFLTGATGSASQYPNIALSDSEDWPIVLGYLLAIVGWLAGPRRVQRHPPPDRRPADGQRQRTARARDIRPGEVLPVLTRPQGCRHPVPGRHDHLLLHGRPVRHGDQDRAAVTDAARVHLAGVRGDRRRARHDDDDADELGHRRAVRQLPGAAHDRLQAGRVPARRGAVVLAHAHAHSSSCCPGCCSAASRSAGPDTRRCPSSPRSAPTRTRWPSGSWASR